MHPVDFAREAERLNVRVNIGPGGFFHVHTASGVVKVAPDPYCPRSPLTVEELLGA